MRKYSSQSPYLLIIPQKLFAPLKSLSPTPYSASWHRFTYEATPVQHLCTTNWRQRVEKQYIRERRCTLLTHVHPTPTLYRQLLCIVDQLQPLAFVRDTRRLSTLVPATRSVTRWNYSENSEGSVEVGR